MRNSSWMQALDLELRARRIGPVQRAEVLAEAESYLDDAGASAFEEFGAPSTYADSIAAALHPPPSPPPSADRRSLLEALDVEKRFGRRVVLHEVSIDLRSGDLLALTGPNGSGKSTLLRILAGLDQPTHGVVRRHEPVGYVPQRGGIDPLLRPDEHFRLFGAAHGLSRSEAEREGSRLARELGWTTISRAPSGRLSGGTVQKLTVVTALLGDPQVLLLDEPYQGMDATSVQRFWELLWAYCEAGRAAVVSSHDSTVLSRATTVIELEEAADVAP